jgi:hypothetical protein
MRKRTELTDSPEVSIYTRLCAISMGTKMPNALQRRQKPGFTALSLKAIYLEFTVL